MRAVIPARVDDVSLLVLLWVEKNDDAPETQNRSGKPLTWKLGASRKRSSPCRVGNEAGVGVRGQTAACGDAQNFLQTHLKCNKSKFHLPVV